jgi:hypothetical protein
MAKISIDEKRANLLLRKLITAEKINLKTKKYNDIEMVKKIKKLIEEEVECY